MDSSSSSISAASSASASSGLSDASSGLPEDAAAADGRRATPAPLKLHLRLFKGPRHTTRVLTLRPSCGARFSNNYYHDTWHLLSDLGGAVILARLLWGLSYQRQAGTIILVDSAHLMPTPFEADPALPFLFSVVDSPAAASLDEEHLAALRRWLRKPGPPATTVKLQTFGMAAALERDACETTRYHLNDDEWQPLWAKERMSKRAGLLCYSAPAEVLRAQALVLQQLPRGTYRGTNHHYLAESRNSRHKYRAPEGEVQIFSDFRERVAAARLGRTTTVERPDLPITDGERWRTWDATERELTRRVADRKRRTARRRDRDREDQNGGQLE